MYPKVHERCWATLVSFSKLWTHNWQLVVHYGQVSCTMASRVYVICILSCSFMYSLGLHPWEYINQYILHSGYKSHTAVCIDSEGKSCAHEYNHVRASYSGWIEAWPHNFIHVHSFLVLVLQGLSKQLYTLESHGTTITCHNHVCNNLFLSPPTT